MFPVVLHEQTIAEMERLLNRMCYNCFIIPDNTKSGVDSESKNLEGVYCRAEEFNNKMKCLDQLLTSIRD